MFKCLFSRHALKITWVCLVHILVLWELLNSFLCGIPVPHYCHRSPRVRQCKWVAKIALHSGSTYPTHFLISNQKVQKYYRVLLQRSFSANIVTLFFFSKEQIKPRNAVWQQIRFFQVTSSLKRITLLHEMSDKTTNLLSAFSFTSLYAMWVSMTWSI